MQNKENVHYTSIKKQDLLKIKYNKTTTIIEVLDIKLNNIIGINLENNNIITFNNDDVLEYNDYFIYNSVLGLMEKEDKIILNKYFTNVRGN